MSNAFVFLWDGFLFHCHNSLSYVLIYMQPGFYKRGKMMAREATRAMRLAEAAPMAPDSVRAARALKALA